MPAGRAPSPNYFQDLRRLRLDQRLDDGTAIDALIDLQQRLADDLGTDFLLIDARTGITSTNTVTTHVLADDVVALTLDTPEQLEGTRSILRSLRPFTSLRTGEPLGVHIVLSRLHPRPMDTSIYDVSAEERKQVARVIEFLTEPAQPATRTLDEDAAVVAMSAAGDDVDRRIELAGFFASPEMLIDARGLRAANGLSRTPRTSASSSRWTCCAGRSNTTRRCCQTLPRCWSRCRRSSLRSVAVRRPCNRSKMLSINTARCPSGTLSASCPDLGSSLNNLSVRLAEAGRRDEGLAAVEEAVTVYRRLVVANPAAYEPDLAGSLDSLSVHVAEVGRCGEGLAALEEAVAVHRRLVAANPAAYEPDPATSLDNLADRLRDLNRRKAAAEATAEAEAISRRLLNRR